MIEQLNPIGLGSENYQIAVAIGNRPELPEYQVLNSIQPVSKCEIANIGLQCGNGWRKVFNVYAKLIFSLANAQYDLVADCRSWQEYRDNLLLQPNSQTALIFGAAAARPISNRVHIICGKTHANQLIESKQIDNQFNWLDSEFAVDKHNRSIICPYFDYRQLSNIKIERLIELIRSI
ncbi:MAG: hypothetical protein ABJI60_19805 [Kangiellaceae bacterium]